MVIYDQLHQFADDLAAQSAFPGHGASWLSNGASVMPTTIWLRGPDGQPVAASGYWLGIATNSEETAAHLRALPSARVAYVRPSIPTPWREAATWSAMPLDSMSVLECGAFAGSGYVFD